MVTGQKGRGTVPRNIDHEFDCFILKLKQDIEEGLGKPVPYSFATNLLFQALPKDLKVIKVVVDTNHKMVNKRMVEFSICYETEKI